MAHMTFTKGFDEYACIGDTITAKVSIGGFYTGLRMEAKLYADDDRTPPDERADGWWPSLDPENPGYIGPKSKSTLHKETAKMEDILRAWRADDWRYVGVCVRAWFDDIPLTDEYAHALWGVECNYPEKGANGNLMNVANELAYECAREAIRSLTDIMERGSK